jgi:SET family sugar efflux transporter-like MFS transporter
MGLQTPPQSQRRIGLALLPLGLVFLSAGISLAVVGPFLSLFLSTEIHAGPVRTTVFLVVAPLAGVLVSSALSRLSDRRPLRRRLLITAALSGVVGTGLTAFVRNYWVLLALAITATALAASMFPQTLAYARQVLQRDSPGRAAFYTNLLRTTFSIAWVAGPPLAAVLLQLGGFRYVYGMAALTYLLAALVAIFWLAEVEVPEATAPAPADEASADRRRIIPIVVAMTLLMAPLTLAVQALPLFISTDLHGDAADAGLILGLCAALEIPLMIGLGALSTRVPLRGLMLAGTTAGVLYYALAAAAPNVGWLFAGQVLNALFIAATNGLGITFVQDMLPGQPGRASTLYSNTFPIGAVLSGPLFGLSQHFGYRLAYVITTGMCLAGLLLLIVHRGPGARSRGTDPAARDRRPA